MGMSKKCETEISTLYWIEMFPVANKKKPQPVKSPTEASIYFGKLVGN
jgi:hypothetical protein